MGCWSRSRFSHPCENRCKSLLLPPAILAPVVVHSLPHPTNPPGHQPHPSNVEKCTRPSSLRNSVSCGFYLIVSSVSNAVVFVGVRRRRTKRTMVRESSGNEAPARTTVFQALEVEVD